jgi:PRC-barrel domain
MTAPIDDVSSLPGRKLHDQEKTPIGKVTEVYAIDGDGHAHWVRVDAKFGMGDTRKVLVPLARLKEEDGELLVPYSKSHIGDTPEVEGDEISEEEERQLRDHYGIDRADQEVRTDNESYASRVVEGPGTPPEEAFEVDKAAAEKEFEKDKDSDEDSSDEDSEKDDSEDDEHEPRASEKDEKTRGADE